MSYLNQVILMGNLGKNPEVLKATDKGVFVKLQLATSKRYLNAKKDWVTNTTWHTVYLNNGIGKHASENYQKGDSLYLVGEIHNEQWTKDSGEKCYGQSIHAHQCVFLSRPDKNKVNAPDAPQSASM